ncbi:MAG: leucine-rich repeat domain-containing protein [Clostridiales bacterium]|nr:leucine-rich repeat domain-containing protein [Clostridiales bacterium]
MKRLAVLIFALALLLCGCAPREETVQVGDWEYRVLPGGTAEITLYRGKKESPSVPSRLGARRVSSVGERAFSGGFPISSVTLPEGVTAIGDIAFFMCGQLERVSMPGSLTHIGAKAFAVCTGLTSLTLPEGVTYIGDGAFLSCDRLARVTVPAGVMEMGQNPFESCIMLKDISVSPENACFEMKDGVLFGTSDRRLVTYPCALKREEYSVPAGTRAIGGRAFAGCRDLAKVTLPEGLTDIGPGAFSGSGLKSVSLPEGIEVIGDEAFSDCYSLTSVTIPDSVTSIGDNAFAECWRLNSLTIPEGVTFIGEQAFYNCGEWLTLTVEKDSYAEKYCKENGLNYQYTDALDWLKD